MTPSARTSIDEFPEKFREKGEAHARAQGEADRLDHLAKVIFAELVNQSNAPSVAKAENEARVHARFREFKEAAINAQTEANVLKAQLEAMRISFDSWRTRQATRRAEMSIT